MAGLLANYAVLPKIYQELSTGVIGLAITVRDDMDFERKNMIMLSDHGRRSPKKQTVQFHKIIQEKNILP